MFVGLRPVDKYPENYDFLDDSYKTSLLEWFSKRKKEMKDAMDAGDFNAAAVLDDKIYTGQEALDAAGICIGYNWINHRDEYFLATLDDAMDEAAYLLRGAHDVL